MNITYYGQTYHVEDERELMLLLAALATLHALACGKAA
jgi:hypothetical protein